MSLEILVTSLIGFIFSIYALFVEFKYSKNKEYKAVCDLTENMSCTKAFSSKYGRIGILSNSLYGIFFYITISILTYFSYLNYIFYLSILSFLGSLYLAYISYFKLKNFCLVCTAIYLVNTLLMIFSYLAVK